MPSALIYLRLSLDREGDKLSIDRQHAWAARVCAERGWDVVGVVTDRDKSARNPGTRPGFADLLARLGEADYVLAWRTDRLWRHVLDQQRFMTLAAVAGVVAVVTSEGDTRIGDDDDEFLSALRALLGGRESKATSKRVAFAMEARAATGAPHMGGRRAFGWETDKVTGYPEELRAIRDGCAMVLRGESCYSVAAEWDRRGLTTPYGRVWRSGDVRKVLTSPRVAGLRVHRGEVLGPALWEPVVARETWEAVRSVLSRAPSGVRPLPATVHLLSGLLVCSVCGTRCDVTTRPSRASGSVPRNASPGRGPRAPVSARVVRDRLVWAVYRCPVAAHVSVADHVAEGEAVEALWSVLDAREHRRGVGAAARALADSGALGEAVEALAVARARVTEVEAMFADGEIGRAEFTRLRSRALARVDTCDAKLRAVQVVPDQIPPVADLRASWDFLGLDERRTVLRGVFLRFDVLAVGRGVRAPRLHPVLLES